MTADNLKPNQSQGCISSIYEGYCQTSISGKNSACMRRTSGKKGGAEAWKCDTGKSRPSLGMATQSNRDGLDAGSRARSKYEVFKL